MNRNGHNMGEFARRAERGFPGGANVPILGQRPAKAKVWRCAAGHEATGDAPPLLGLPDNPLAPVRILTVTGVCLICVLEHLQAQFPMTEVMDGDPSAPPEE